MKSPESIKEKASPKKAPKQNSTNDKEVKSFQPELLSSESDGEYGSGRESSGSVDSRPLKKRIPGSGLSKERLFLKQQEIMLTESVSKSSRKQMTFKDFLVRHSESKGKESTKPTIKPAVSTEDHSYSTKKEGPLSPLKRSKSPQKSVSILSPKSPPISVANAPSSSHQVEVEEENLPLANPHVGKEHPRPPLPSDVLIALAVRNLDPNNYYGASFSSIISFLTLHFPYYHRNVEECRDMVRGAYDISSKEETGKENYRIKASLVEQLALRIKSYVDRSNVTVRESMLFPGFLDVLVDRFSNGSKPHPAACFRPPTDSRMMAYLALVTLCPPTSVEHIEIFLKFLFPSLQSSLKMENLEEGLGTDPLLEEHKEKGQQGKYFVVKEGRYQDVLRIVRNFFRVKINQTKLKRSIYKPDFVNMLLPNLVVE